MIGHIFAGDITKYFVTISKWVSCTSRLHQKTKRSLKKNGLKELSKVKGIFFIRLKYLLFFKFKSEISQVRRHSWISRCWLSKLVFIDPSSQNPRRAECKHNGTIHNVCLGYNRQQPPVDLQLSLLQKNW